MGSFQPTIIALATPRARSAIHILRVSGNKALPFLKFHTSLKVVPPRQALVALFSDKKKPVDRVLCLYFKAPRSYTGEELVEIHCHGSIHIADTIIKAALRFGIELAKPGEFTRRAWLGGKMSLEQAEATGSLIHASSDKLRELSLSILERKSSLRFHDIKEQIIDIASDLETSIEFGGHDSGLENEKKKFYLELEKKISGLENYFRGILGSYRKGMKIEEGLRVVIAGAPNAGKSTLMNALLRHERVLVSSVRGTTRDFINEKVDLEGFPIILTDTAGLRDRGAKLERAGMAKAIREIASADLILFLVCQRDGVAALDRLLRSLPDDFDMKNILVFITKTDLLKRDPVEKITREISRRDLRVADRLSLLDEKAASRVEKQLLSNFKRRFKPQGDELALLNERQALASERILAGLERLKARLRRHEGEELIAQELQELRFELETLDVNHDRRDLDDAIFSKFCLGK